MKYLSRAAWFCVLCVTLGMSAWSLYVVTRHFGLPPLLAALASVTLDGAALVSANIALEHAQEAGDSGLGPRALVVALGGLSSWLNAYHAELSHMPVQAATFYAALPVTSLTLWELHQRWQRRRALAAAGRSVAPMPVYGLMMWLRHPLLANSSHQQITRTRIESRTAIEQSRDTSLAAREQAGMQRAVLLAQRELDEVTNSVSLAGVSKKRAIELAWDALGDDASVSDVRDWIADRGLSVTPQYVRLNSNGRVQRKSLSSEPYAEIPGSFDGLPQLPAARPDDTVMLGGARAGNRILLGCGCAMRADKSYRIGDDANCPTHGITPYAYNLSMASSAK